jgi:hypothetical protein
MARATIRGQTLREAEAVAKQKRRVDAVDQNRIESIALLLKS